MKKYSLFSILTILISCTGSENISFQKDGNMFVSQLVIKDGASKPQEIKYKVDSFVVNVLKLSKKTVDSLYEDAVVEAKSSLKNSYTFEFLPITEYSGFIYSTPEDSVITVSVDYVGQNSFGVKSKNLGIIKYNKTNYNQTFKMFN